MESNSPFTVKIEWRVENLTCWKRGFHARYIESPNCASLPDFKASLDPDVLFRIPGMKVSCSFGPYEGELSFIGADQSVVSTEVIRAPKEENEGAIVVPAPDLSEVAMRLRDDHGDHVVLLFHFVVPGVRISVCMCSSVEVLSDVSLPLTASKLMEDYRFEEPEVVMAFTYDRPREDDTKAEEVVHLVKKIHNWAVTTLEFRMKSATDWAFSNILVKSYLILVDHENTLIWDDEDHRILHSEETEESGKEDFLLFDLIDRQLSVQGRTVKLRFQFVSGKIKSSVKSLVHQNSTFAPVSRDRPSPENVPSDANENPPVLGKELMSLFQNKEFADFELRCGNSTFAAHRAILSARSPVFKTMLSKDMREASTGSVDIEDLDATTLEQFLAFLYSGAVGNLQGESAFKLYYAADKYRVPTLKTKCVDFLSANISVSNACDVLSLADKHKDLQLLTSAQNFILDKFEAVSRSKEWQRYMLDDPRLLVKAVTLIAAKGYFSCICSRKS